MRKSLGARANRMRRVLRSRRSERRRVVVLHGVVKRRRGDRRRVDVPHGVGSLLVSPDCCPVDGEARCGHELLGLREGDGWGDAAGHDLVVGVGCAAGRQRRRPSLRPLARGLGLDFPDANGLGRVDRVGVALSVRREFKAEGDALLVRHVFGADPAGLRTRGTPFSTGGALGERVGVGLGAQVDQVRGALSRCFWRGLDLWGGGLLVRHTGGHLVDVIGAQVVVHVVPILLVVVRLVPILL